MPFMRNLRKGIIELKYKDTMIEVNLNKYGAVINTEQLGEQCYNDIMSANPNEKQVLVRMKEIVSMTTTRAKQIFGRIYKEIGEEKFTKNIVLDVTDGVYIIIEMGLEEILKDMSRNIENPDSFQKDGEKKVRV